MRKNLGLVFMVAGALLLVASLSIFIHNRIEDASAGDAAASALEQLELSEGNATYDPDSEMTVKEIDGYGYVGYLSIPSLGLELPVMSEWDYERLRIAPCRYFGSTKTDDLVICGHNYSSHFGTLQTLEAGAAVYFMDMDGVTWAYEVAQVETLQPTQVEDMIDGSYALTLYTCTYGGQSRVTVRCDRVW